MGDAEADATIAEVLARPNARREVLAPLLWAMVSRARVSACAPRPGRLAEVLMKLDFANLDYLAVETPDAPSLVLSFGRFPDEVLGELVERPKRVQGDGAAGLAYCLVERGATIRVSERWARWARDQKAKAVEG